MVRGTSTSLSRVNDMEEQDVGFASDAADGRSSTHSGLFVSDDDRPTTPEPVVRPKLQRRRFPSFEIRVPPVKRRKTYVSYPEELVVSKVVGQASDSSGEVLYDVKCGDGEYVTLPYIRLLRRPNGPSALSTFNIASPQRNQSDSEMSEAMSNLSSSHRRQAGARRARPKEFVDPDDLDLSDDEGLITMSPPRPRQRRQASARNPVTTSSGQANRSVARAKSPADPSISPRARISRRSQRNLASSRPDYSNDVQMLSDDDPLPSRKRVRRSTSSDSLPFVLSDLLPPPSKAQLLARMKRARNRRHESSEASDGGIKRRKSTKKQKRAEQDDSYSVDHSTRRSGRTGRRPVDMRERGEEESWPSDDDNAEDYGIAAVPRAIGVRETFKELPRSSSFLNIHCQWCDTCGQYGSNAIRGNLVFCQGCTVSYHKDCLGPRNGREHLVSKIGDRDFVLQCRRCVRMGERKDPMVPRQDMCQICKEPGTACAPFHERKTTRQEEEQREKNDGQDPIISVDQDIINNAENLLFRCTDCQRAFHFDHLPPLEGDERMESNCVTVADRRYAEYCEQWKCRECVNAPAKVQTLVAWRPIDLESYPPGATVEQMPEDSKEYLVKWNKLSYHRTTWLPGAWVWGMTAVPMRKAFARKSNGYNLPTMKVEDAIPEDFFRVDIVLDVRYTSLVSIHTEEIDKARIREVREALVKFKGLPYEEVVWEVAPGPEDGERWKDFVVAYDDWVLGRYIHLPKQKYLYERLEKARAQDFQTKLLKHKQPENLVGGEMMGYQMEGLNWAYYKWYKKQNAILADEMGLGKTIQIIGLLATLVQDHKCWPFLVVVPNSTCPNWRREIKRWAPSLRVVAYYGSSEARRIAMKYELYPDGSKDLKCHIVVTSFDAPSDDHSKRFFRTVPWAGLIVDEGQRLKSDKNQLYETLRHLDVPFKILMTGTPLQNNARELFNLLQFLDPDIKAAAMEQEYAELTKENVPKLHDLIRPFFLRRTKAQVLTFLPPMAQIIVPVTMSVVQKKLYKSILAKNPELIKSICNREKLKQNERHNLNNILMQLRKCLCHPFVFSNAIEERNVNAATSHRSLVEASSKLQLLDIMLPKLQERGHRVLIFSQFLNMLDIIEDFLDGLGMPFERLDGTIGTLEKQKRIDRFNAPDSPLFAFLLSTRAGGVGINLATADTVIITDPDFNPHQDIQALSRAHRIGQKKKVLVFQLMTRDSAEEKIVQVGRKKMALDHILVEQMDTEDDVAVGLETILLHGAAALFNDDDKNDIHYDSASVDKLLDRSQAEDTKTGDDNSAESQFSFARIWANDNNELRDGLDGTAFGEDSMPDPTVWDQILRDREQQAAMERAARQEALGRGKRKRKTVEYTDRESQLAITEGDRPSSPTHLGDNDGDGDDHHSDMDFEIPEAADVDSDAASLDAIAEAVDASRPTNTPVHPGTVAAPPAPPTISPFRRAWVQPPTINPSQALPQHILPSTTIPLPCIACMQHHRIGYCPLKLAGAEKCPLCGIAHYGDGPICPHLRSETQVRRLIEALKRGSEGTEIVEEAMKYLRGRKGAVVRAAKMNSAGGEATPAGPAIAAQVLPSHGIVVPDDNSLQGNHTFSNGVTATAGTTAETTSRGSEIIDISGLVNGGLITAGAGTGLTIDLTNGQRSPTGEEWNGTT